MAITQATTATPLQTVVAGTPAAKPAPTIERRIHWDTLAADLLYSRDRIAVNNALLQRVLVLKKGLHLADTREESEWREHKALAGVRSWIAVPLVASDTVLGLFSIGSKLSRAFTTEHFRLAKLLAIPAAVAIHNARLYEWAQIYAAERQSLLRKLDESSNAPLEDTVPRRGRLPS